LEREGRADAEGMRSEGRESNGGRKETSKHRKGALAGRAMKGYSKGEPELRTGCGAANSFRFSTTTNTITTFYVYIVTTTTTKATRQPSPSLQPPPPPSLPLPPPQIACKWYGGAPLVCSMSRFNKTGKKTDPFANVGMGFGPAAGAHCTLHTTHYTLHTAHYTLHTTRSCYTLHT
jgi:hypothetical protein